MLIGTVVTAAAAGSLPSVSHSYDVLRQAVADCERDGPVELSHRILSWYVTSFDVSTLCFYNIHDENKRIFLDVSASYSSVDRIGLEIDGIRHEMEAQTHHALMLARDFADTERSCVLEPNDIGKIRFTGDVVITTVVYSVDIVANPAARRNCRREKVLLGFPLPQYQYECLYGFGHCDLRTHRFRTNF